MQFERAYVIKPHGTNTNSALDSSGLVQVITWALISLLLKKVSSYSLKTNTNTQQLMSDNVTDLQLING